MSSDVNAHYLQYCLIPSINKKITIIKIYGERVGSIENRSDRAGREGAGENSLAN